MTKALEIAAWLGESGIEFEVVDRPVGSLTWIVFDIHFEVHWMVWEAWVVFKMPGDARRFAVVSNGIGFALGKLVHIPSTAGLAIEWIDEVDLSKPALEAITDVLRDALPPQPGRDA